MVDGRLRVDGREHYQRAVGHFINRADTSARGVPLDVVEQEEVQIARFDICDFVQLPSAVCAYGRDGDGCVMVYI